LLHVNVSGSLTWLDTFDWDSFTDFVITFFYGL
jgi:hypothetical protein